MNGARRLARDFIAPMMRLGLRVLDICGGDEWVWKEFPEIHYENLDGRAGTDLVRDPWYERAILPDLILSIYGLQHLLAEEARVWTLLRRIAKPSTKFVYVGRYIVSARRETNREDPLNGYDCGSFGGLALASGWKVKRFDVFYYEGDVYRIQDSECPYVGNAFAAILEPLE